MLPRFCLPGIDALRPAAARGPRKSSKKQNVNVLVAAGKSKDRLAAGGEKTLGAETGAGCSEDDGFVIVQNDANPTLIAIRRSVQGIAAVGLGYPCERASCAIDAKEVVRKPVRIM